MSGDRQHYLPAVLIGGFGDDAGKSPRDATVCWRRREWDAAQETKAEAIGWRSRMYRLSNPIAGVDPDVVDGVWKGVESRLSGAVRRTEASSETDEDRAVILNYAAMLGVRHHQFEAVVNRWLAELGRAAVSGDQVHEVRLDTLRNTLQQVRDFRWRFLHSPADAPRIILNDLGWAYVGHENKRGRNPGRALYIPLNSRVAAVAWLSPSRTGGFDHQILRPNWVRWLNAAVWHEAPEFVAGHTEDAAELAKLCHPHYVRARYTLALGAFKDIHGRTYLLDEIGGDVQGVE